LLDTIPNLLTEVMLIIAFVILNEVKYLEIIQNRNLEILRSAQNNSFALLQLLNTIYFHNGE